MNLIQLIACAGLITGCFVLLRISPMDFTEGVFSRITSKPKSIRAEINESTRRKRKSILRREIEEAQTILRMTGRAAKFPMVCALSLLLFLVGAAFALALFIAMYLTFTVNPPHISLFLDSSTGTYGIPPRNLDAGAVYLDALKEI